jgi:hypothetical protein
MWPSHGQWAWPAADEQGGGRPGGGAFTGGVRLAVLLLLNLGACTATPRPESCKPTEGPAPGPTVLHVEASLTLRLPPEFAKQVSVPEQGKGSLLLDIKSEVIRTSPLRSRHHGSITVVLKNLDGTQTYVDFSTTVDGEADGTPNEGVGQVLHRFGSAVDLLGKPLGSLQARPASP